MFASIKKSCTFVLGLSKEVLSPINLLVISFSVINYVVSMRCPRGSDDSSFFIYTPVYIKNEPGLEESGLSNPSRLCRQPL